MTKRLSYTMSYALERATRRWTEVPWGLVGWPTLLALETRGLIEKRLTGRYPRYHKWQWRRTRP